MKFLSIEVLVAGLVIIGVAILWWCTIQEGKELLNANESEPVVYAYHENTSQPHTENAWINELA